MKVRYVFEDGSYSIYRIKEVEMGLLKTNLSMLKNGSSSIISRDIETGIRDINNNIVFLNDVITYDDNKKGSVYLEEGIFKVNGETLSSLKNIKTER